MYKYKHRRVVQLHHANDFKGIRPVRIETQNSWQVKGFKTALRTAAFEQFVALEAYLGNRINMQPDTTGSVFQRGTEVGI